ncbi:MAG: beta-Ala-His dipeptidase [Promethearchaeota archaeon]
MSILKDLGEPEVFWDYFERISKIPRCSRYEERIRNFIKDEAEQFEFKTLVDKVGNLVIFIPASTSKREKCILQCHLDMVCEKNESVVHDFTKDPLKLKIIDVDNEKWVTAEGTTLGADDGTGICYLLTIMKEIYMDNLKFNSLSLELLFTVREEYDMGGAKNINKDLMDGKYLINLDSGRDGMITIGCTGGIGFIAKIKTKSISVDQIKEEIKPIKIFLKGLVGGHSGGDINRGRAHAIKLLCQILWKLNNDYVIYISSINGGGAANVIPREANAIIYIKEHQFSEIESKIKLLFSEIKKNYDGIEENMQILIEEIEAHTEETVFSTDVQPKLLDLLYVIPSGPLSIHPKVRAYAFTSTNLGILKTKKDYIKLRMLHRSFSDYHNLSMCEKVSALLDISGLEMTKTITGRYPPWTPNFNFELLNLAKDTYKSLFNKDARIMFIQGGLESTLLIHLNPEIEAIAIGPNTKGIHSPNERLHVNSVGKTWNLLINILKKLD